MILAIAGCGGGQRITYYQYQVGHAACNARELDFVLDTWAQRFALYWTGEKEDPPPARRVVVFADLPGDQGRGLRMYVWFVHHERAGHYELELSLVAYLGAAGDALRAQEAPRTYELPALWQRLAAACHGSHIASL